MSAQQLREFTPSTLPDPRLYEDTQAVLIAADGTRSVVFSDGRAWNPAPTTADLANKLQNSGQQVNTGLGAPLFWAQTGLGDFEKRLSMNGALINGIDDDSAAWQAALNSFAVAGKRKRLKMPEQGLVSKMMTPITINVAAVGGDLESFKFDFSGVNTATFTGAAVSLTGQSVAPFDIGSNANYLSGFQLVGPYAAPTYDQTTPITGAVDGLYVGVNIGAATGPVPGHSSFRNIHITGFRDGIRFGNDVYILNFDALHLNRNRRHGIHYAGSQNSGESIVFTGMSLSDTVSSAGNGIGLYVPSSAGGPNIMWYGGSASYNNQAFDFQTGILNCFGVHFESANNSLFGQASYSATRPPTKVLIKGGVISHGPIGNQTEQTGGRATCFLIPSSSLERVSFSIEDAVWDVFDLYNPELLRSDITSAATNVSGLQVNQSGNNLGSFGRQLQRMANPGFELAIPSGWTVTPGNTTFTRDTTTFYSGARSLGGAASLSMVAAGGATAGAYEQSFEVGSNGVGRNVWVKLAYNCTAYTAGFAVAKIEFLNAGGGIIAGADLTITGDILATTAGWVLKSVNRVIPTGAAKVRVRLFNGSNFNGTVYFDDVQMWIV